MNELLADLFVFIGWILFFSAAGSVVVQLLLRTKKEDK